LKRIPKLTKEQLTELKNFMHEKSTDKIEASRVQAILMLNQNIGYDVLEEITGYSKRQAFHLRRQYCAKGLDCIKTKKRPAKCLLTKQQRIEICELLKNKTPKDYEYENDYWTTAIVGHLIKQMYGVHYKSKTPIYILFREAKMSFHKPGFHYDRRDQAKIDTWKQWAKPIIEEALKDDNTIILTGDEMMVTTQTTFQKIWLPLGQFPQITVSTNRKRRCVYGFVDLKTGREYAFKTIAANSEETVQILEQLAQLHPNKKIIIFWDNAIWHKSTLVKEFLGKTKYKFYLINFPPYAPDENPQEHVWKEGRAKITHNKFINNIDAIVDDLVNYLNSNTFRYKFL
jgi:transposase